MCVCVCVCVCVCLGEGGGRAFGCGGVLDAEHGERGWCLAMLADVSAAELRR